METMTVEINIPKEMIPFVVTRDENIMLKRNALLLYPYIENNTISHGKAAELLGIYKIDLINLYGEMGLPYLDMYIEEVIEDVDAISALKGSKV